MKCVAVSLTYTRGTPKVLHHVNKDSAVASAVQTTILGQTLRSLRATLVHMQVVKIHYFIRRGPVDRLTERTGTTSPERVSAQ